ncbi:MAG: hypothetical protein NT149_05035 [Candidatus Gottesmanbacteria bacterium]|nr:hypothetical protein [Candidatus Gottesmanbacteria bacterium]
MKTPSVTKTDIQEIVQKEIRASEQRLSGKLDTMIKDFHDTKEEMTLQMGKYAQINDIEERVDTLEHQVKKLVQPAL